MPKITPLDPTKRRLEAISDYIRGELKRQHKNQEDLAELLGLAQQSVSIKLKAGRFTVKELLLIFDYLKTPTEKRAELIAA